MPSLILRSEVWMTYGVAIVAIFSNALLQRRECVSIGGFHFDRRDVVPCCDAVFNYQKVYRVGERTQIHEECVKVVEVVLEQSFDVGTNLVEVQQDIALVFVSCKFFDDIAFAYTASTIDENGTFSMLFFLPFQKLLIYFSLHITPIRDYLQIFSSLLARINFCCSWLFQSLP